MTQRKTIKYMKKESVEKGTEGYITPAKLYEWLKSKSAT